MKIDVNRLHTIADVQRAFASCFPGLRIEFYRQHHHASQGSPKEEQLPKDKTLGELGMPTQQAILDLDPAQSVADFEAQIERKLGVPAQVFRRSNQLWLQTSTTDSWTLEVQNRKGLHSVQTE
ncbi:MAG: hypothetical protein D6772_10560 [Bacteroidetes bacterium]|nr:MAG: hypothetical protein D6772_10560 [Bacteroidota bacterium]